MASSNRGVDPLSLLFTLYIATVITSLGISLFQFYYEKRQVYRFSIYFWLTISLSLFINIVSDKLNFTTLAISGFGTFLSQLILGYILSQILKVKFETRLYTTLFILVGLIAEFTPFIKNNRTLYIVILCSVETLPALVTSLKVLFNSKLKKTSSQILLAVFTLLMSLHYLDYAFSIQDKNYYLLVLAVAFFLLHSISALIPMAVNEVDLQIRNENLELEIRERVESLRKADFQLWQNNRLSTLGHFAGIIAHEINTPLSTISVSAQYILNQLFKPDFDLNKISEKMMSIKHSVHFISEMTHQLKTVAGESTQNVLSKLNLKDILIDINRSFNELPEHAAISLNDITPNKKSYISARENDVEHIFRNIIQFFSIDTLDKKSTSESQIFISLKTNHQHVELNFRKNDNNHLILSSANYQGQSPVFLNLNFTVAKSLAERNKGSLHYDQDTHAVILKFTAFDSQEKMKPHQELI